MTSRPDPYCDLADALRGVVAEAVADGVARALAAGTCSGDAVLVSIPEAARQLGLGVTKLKELIAAGEIESRVVGRRRLIAPGAVATFAARGTA